MTDPIPEITIEDLLRRIQTLERVVAIMGYGQLPELDKRMSACELTINALAESEWEAERMKLWPPNR